MEKPGYLPHRRLGRLRISVPLVAVLALIASSCASDDGGSTVAATTTAPETAETTATSAETTTTSTAVSTTAVSSSTTTAAGVVLQAGGIAVGDGAWKFGDSAAAPTAALAKAFGKPAKVETQECEAGRTQMHYWPDLTALVQEGKLDGWSVPPLSRDVRTDRGLGIGSSRRELVAAYPQAEIAESSLGVEWSVDDRGAFLAGILESEDPSAQITALWSGNACVFR